MFLGIDVGTSGVKAVIIDEAGTVVTESRAGLTVSHPHPLWSEQDPSDWWAATNTAVSQLDHTARSRVRAVGLSGQMHGAVLLNKARKVIRPAILWNDGRSEAECHELLRREPRAHELTGNLIMAGFTAPKLLWVKKHEPQIWDEVDLVLLPKDYIRLRMTGETATDLSDASGTLWVDVGHRSWSDEMLAACELTKANMPWLCEGVEATGILRDELAEAWGMARVPVCAGGGDNAAGAVGVGVIHDGDALLSLGTSGVLFAATAQFRPNVSGTVHAFCHAIPDRWHQMSVMLNAASCLDWVVALTGASSVEGVLKNLESSGATDTPELFLPYLTGERTPHNDPHAKGVFFGMTASTGPAQLALATLQGVALALADGMDVLTDAGTRFDSITVIGGGSRSPYWGRILASALNKPLIYRTGADLGPSYGAARLARLSIGDGDIESVCTAPTIESVIEPDRQMSDILAAKRPTFLKIYQSLKPHFKDL
ncbi:MAG: xylulokinase [Asticcacaulis sp.]